MIVRMRIFQETRMPTTLHAGARKGRVTLSIDQELLNRLEPFKHEVNLSALAEQTFQGLLERLENRSWAERNAEALQRHGREIARTGLAGAEFERI